MYNEITLRCIIALGTGLVIVVALILSLIVIPAVLKDTSLPAGRS